MPIGPNGEKRPVSPTSNAVHVMRIAAGLVDEEYIMPEHAAKAKKREKQCLEIDVNNE